MTREELQRMYGSVPKGFEARVASTLQRTREETKMKKKIPLGLVIALALMLALGVAFAVAGWYDAAGRIATLEAERGYFDEWDAGERTELVRLLAENGALEADARVERLLAGGLDAAEASRLATEIITEWGNMREDVVTLMSILERVWGRYPDAWSVEQLAWYTQTLIDTGRIGGDEERFLLPGEGDLPRADAERIAREAVMAAEGLTDADLAGWTVTAEFYTMPGAQDGPKWLIKLHAPQADGSLAWPAYSVAVSSPAGEVIEDPVRGIGLPGKVYDEVEAYLDMVSNPVVVAVNEWLHREVGFVFYTAPIEQKAAFSREMRPLVLDALAAGDTSLDPLSIALAAHEYGLPGPDDLPQAEALTLARDAVTDAFGIPADALDYYGVHAYYDITDPDTPVWRFYFNRYNSDHYGDKAYDSAVEPWARGYRVELDARTGALRECLEHVNNPDEHGETLFRWFL